MKRTTRSRYVAGFVALGLIAAACGSDDAPGADPAPAPAAPDPTVPDPAPAPAPADLSAVCPSPLVIQTDWFPEAEHGAMYSLIGEGYTVDTDNLVVSGPGVGAGGAPLGIDIEVRTGGPAIGYAAPRVQMYTDDSIHIGYTSTDNQVTNWADLPLVAVMAPLDINPQIIMWDADTYPDVNTIADIGEQGIPVNIFAGGGFSDFFVAQGLWSADQVDASYDGSPARFIAEGDLAQQGFASAEPYKYEFVFEEYGKAPRFQLLHDAGFQIYSQALGVKPTELENLRPCLEQFVPIAQQAAVDFAASPDRANAIIIDAVAQYDSFWTYDEGVANYAVETMNTLGLHGNGGDGIVGNMDESRFQTIIEDTRAIGLDAPDDLVASDMFTNEFIDTSIGFPG